MARAACGCVFCSGKHCRKGVALTYVASAPVMSSRDCRKRVFQMEEASQGFERKAAQHFGAGKRLFSYLFPLYLGDI